MLPITRLLSRWMVYSLSVLALAQDASPLRIETGLDRPVSVAISQSAKAAYVVNRGGGGFVAVLDLEQPEREPRRLVGGLDSPAGSALLGETLYVVHAQGVAEIDIKSGQVETRAITGRQLTGIAVDDNGVLYVSDLLANKIVRLDGNQQETFARGASLHQPNHLLLQHEQLFIACQGGPQAKGAIRVMPLSAFADNSLYSEPIGRLYGIASDGGFGFFVSDTDAGRILHVSESGAHRTMFRVESPMGLAYDHVRGRLWATTSNSKGILIYNSKP